MPDDDTIEFEWCSDCLMLHANGEIGDLGELPSWMDRDAPGAHLYNWPGDDQDENAAQRHAALMDKQWPHDEWDVSMNCPEECDGWFSSSPCEGCGTRLGGDRHPAVAWPKPKLKLVTTDFAEVF